MRAPRIYPGSIYLSQVKSKELLLRIMCIKLVSTGVAYSTRSRSTYRTVYHVRNINTGERMKLNTARHFISEIIPDYVQ